MGDYELQTLNEKCKSFNSAENFFTKEEYPFLFKPSFSTLGSMVEKPRTEPINNFVRYDSIRDFSGFDPVIIFEKN